MNFDDLTWLVDETLKLAAEGHVEAVAPVQPAAIIEPPIKQEAGIIYYLESKTASSLLKCLPIKDIESEFKKLHSNQVFESSLFSLIQNNKIESIDSLSFFPTENYEEAEFLFKTFAEERYPLKKMHEIENAWWLEYDDNSFKLFFKSYGLLDTTKSIYLGPLSKLSNLDVMRNFKLLMPELKNDLKFSEYQLSPSKFSFNYDQKGYPLAFKEFINLFLEGRPTGAFSDPDTINFLKTVGLSRRFWLQLSKMLN